MTTPPRGDGGGQVNYFDPHVLAAVSSLSLRARMIVEGLMTGMHRSPYQGFSVEFAQHRPYTPGDDTRFLDWKVYGKTDKLYLKQYRKETNMDLLLLVDASTSMAFGGPTGKQGDAPWSKYDCGATVAAAMAHLALGQQDRVSAWVCDRDPIARTRASNRRDHWRTVSDALASARPTMPRQMNVHAERAPEDEGFAGVLDRALASLTRRSLVVIVSDMLDELGPLEKRLARLHHRRHDAMLVQVVDQHELSFDLARASDLVGLEGEGMLAVDPAALRDAYQQLVAEHEQKLERMANRLQFDFARIVTRDSLGPVLSQFLARRAARLSRSV